MGCCANEKGSEEDEILLYFNKILKENAFDFTIKNYSENYHKIQKLSGNNFKKLCKKQNVRIGFIKKIKNDGKTNKKEDFNKLLYNIIILTHLLDNKMKEDDFLDDNYNEINKMQLNSLKTELLSYGYYLFSNIIPEQYIKKNIIYHLAKLFFLCFKDNDVSNDYLSVKEYINIIKEIINDKSLEDEEETYIFIRDNILSLGEFFHYNNKYSLSDEEIINILIELYCIILFHHFEYLINNYDLIKENINKNVRNTTHKLMNFNLKTINKDNILPNITETFDIVNSSKINIKNNYKDTQDINLIIESIYNFLKVSAPDINSGKNVLKIIGNKLKEKNKDNKINDFILLLLFYECCIKDDETITCGLLEYITDLFLNEKSNVEINENNIYYDIMLDSYYLIYKNETLSKQYIFLLSQIFIKENEKNLKKNILLSQLIHIYHKKEKIMNKIIKLFFYFLINISHYYKEKINSINNNENIINNEDNNSIIINNILINLNSLIKSLNNNEFSNINNDNNNLVSSSTNNVTYNIYNNNINLIKIGIDDYNLLILHFFNFKNLKEEPNINSIEFYLYFHLFLINNTDIIELINDYPKKDKIYHNTLKIITILEIMLIQSSDQENNKSEKYPEDNKRNIYIYDIIMAVQIIIKVIDKVDTKYYIQDCYILYNSLEKNIQNLLELQKLNENGSNEIDFFNLRIIYSIIFFILSQFIRLINIPNSIKKNHKEILDCILKSNGQCGECLSIIDVSNFNSYNKSSLEPNIQYLKELLLSEENKEKYFFNYNSLKQILDIIYSKIFGKDTSLHIFFDNQIMNSKYFYDIENCYNNNLSKESDNITEVKDSSIINKYDNNYNENDIDEISLHIVEQKNKIKNNDNQSDNLFISNNSNINMPHKYENNQIFERTLTNSITNEENLFRNIKL